MATLDSRGLVNDGTANLTVGGVTTVNAELMAVNTVVGSGSIALPASGFYQFTGTGSSGQGAFTGSLPAPISNPGGTLLVTDNGGFFNYLISGSMAMASGSLSNVVGAGGSIKSVNGTKLTVSPGGSVGFWSDSKGWLVCAVSGTLTLAP